MVIYKITNLINNKIYIGQTIRTMKERWACHGHTSKNTYISRAIQKYGKENFTIEQIDSANSIEELNEKEIYWIKFYDSTNREKGYNVEVGGNDHSYRSPETIEKQRKSMLGKGKGRKPSEETLQKMRTAQLGRKRRPFSEETIRKMREKATGRKHTEESKQKMKEYRTGRKNSPEHIEKSRLAHLGKPLTEEHKRKISESHLKRSKEKKQNEH